MRHAKRVQVIDALKHLLHHLLGILLAKGATLNNAIKELTTSNAIHDEYANKSTTKDKAGS